MVCALVEGVTERVSSTGAGQTGQAPTTTGAKPSTPGVGVIVCSSSVGVTVSGSMLPPPWTLTSTHDSPRTSVRPFSVIIFPASGGVPHSPASVEAVRSMLHPVSMTPTAPS